MEGLRLRVIVVGAAFLLLGVAFHMKPPTVIMHDGKAPDEKWLESITPKQLPQFNMQVRTAGPEVTYRMTKETYDTLVPYGIVARVFDDGYRSFDSVVIMSSKKDSFHDPRICFTSQGWTLDQQEIMMVKTKVHGTIPVTLTTMINGSQKSFAAFFYRGPNGFVAKNSELKLQMFKHQLLRFQDTEGVFYRFIPMYPAATKADLASFIDTFLTETDKSSKGLI